MDADDLDGNRALREQWEFHWNRQIRARLDGLTDDEYFWSPVPDAWSVRPRGGSVVPGRPGSGDFTIDYAFPEPVPRPSPRSPGDSATSSSACSPRSTSSRSSSTSG